MKRIGRDPPRRLLSRAELMRLMSLIFMAVIVLMLVQSARDPDLWRNWVPQNGQQRVGDDDTEPSAQSKAKGEDGARKIEGHSDGRPAAKGPAQPPNAASPKRHDDSALAQANPSDSAATPGPPQPVQTKGAGPSESGPDTSAISNGKQPGAAGNPPKPAVPGAETGKANPAAENAMPDGDAATTKAPAITAATGPTDEDPDEQAEAAEDFDAIEDAESVAIEPQEAQAYERIVRWVTNQPYALLVSRAKFNHPTFGEFIEAPVHHREPGKLYQFDFRVQRMLKIDEPFTFDHSDDDPHQPVTLYELWGTIDERSGRLVSLIVYDPPKNMPLGSMLRENVHFAGYFFKLLAYEPTKGLPGGKLLKAPIFIGRIDWIRPPPPVLIGSNDVIWAIVLGGGSVLAILVWSGRVLFNRKARNLAPLATERSLPPGVSIDQWLDKAQTGEDRVANDDPETAPIVIDDKEAPHASNGHSEGRRQKAEG